MPYSSAMGFRDVRHTCRGLPKNSVTLGRRTVSPAVGEAWYSFVHKLP